MLLWSSFTTTDNSRLFSTVIEDKLISTLPPSTHNAVEMLYDSALYKFVIDIDTSWNGDYMLQSHIRKILWWYWTSHRDPLQVDKFIVVILWSGRSKVSDLVFLCIDFVCITNCFYDYEVEKPRICGKWMLERCICVYVSFMYHQYNQRTGDADIKRRRRHFTNFRFELFRHDLCRYKVWVGARVGQKVPPCVWGEYDFHVNWLHVSRIRPTHWRLNDDFDINQHRRSPFNTRHTYTTVCVVCVMEDSYGDTGLHDAVSKDNTELIDLLLHTQTVDLLLRNTRGFNVLHHAALKGNN